MTSAPAAVSRFGKTPKRARRLLVVAHPTTDDAIWQAMRESRVRIALFIAGQDFPTSRNGNDIHDDRLRILNNSGSGHIEGGCVLIKVKSISQWRLCFEDTRPGQSDLLGFASVESAAFGRNR